MAQAIRGLQGVLAADSSICHIDGKRGRLVYRGYNINDLAKHSSFEEVAYLLWHNKLPNRRELARFTNQLRRLMTLPVGVIIIFQFSMV